MKEHKKARSIDGMRTPKRSGGVADEPFIKRRRVDEFGLATDADPFEQANGSAKPNKLTRRQRREQASVLQDAKKLRRKKRRKRIAIIILLVLLLSGGYFGYKFFVSSGRMFGGNPLTALFGGKALAQDETGWSHIVAFGTSEDDPLQGHGGSDLADSIILFGVHQDKKQAYMVSVPRDFQVQYPSECRTSSGKINAVFQCGEDEEDGQRLMRQTIGTIFGVPVQYSAHANYTVLKDMVNAVGGITVTIDSSDPRGILDRGFDWQCPDGPYTCYFVRYPNGPVELDGDQALKLSRARGEKAPTYGLSRSNPDREDNQRRILSAIQDKAISAGTLSNPVRWNKILDALSDNLRTNFDVREVRTAVGLLKDINGNAVQSISLSDPRRNLLGSCGGNICPVAGTYDYSQLQGLVRLYQKSPAIASEQPTIDVRNATNTGGLATKEAEKLEKLGFSVAVIGDAASTFATSGSVQIYQVNANEKQASLQYLEDSLGAKSKGALPQGVTSSSDFVIIIGNDAASTN